MEVGHLKNEFVQHIKDNAIRFDSIDDLQPMLEKASEAQFVLLGEATHGTSEFYRLRTEISKWLIEKKGFQFIAVEGDWPACYEANRYIKGYSSVDNARDALQQFNRWPTWMWANEEVAELLTWLRSYNDSIQKAKVGFYGIDIYSLWESMQAVVQHLEEIGSPVAADARKAFHCFEPFHREPQLYGVSASLYGEDCLEELLQLLDELQKAKHNFPKDNEATLNLQVNSIVADNAEHYYRAMVTNDNESWNIRDRHMVQALDEILTFYRKGKGIIWEHNTHIGDARATDMVADGMVNVGQLARERYGRENVYSIGFGTYEGTVIAADRWGEPMKVMAVPKASPHSWEAYLHEAGAFNKFIHFHDKNEALFSNTMGHRAIGVTYNPHYEQYGNYVPSQLSKRYDGFIHVEKTTALHPLVKSNTML
ncbi:erythromycin esterase family protein [Alkalihalobacterium bogoriense]|uniref:erythromycin esterase family protein n=1 Tax=Alkalihalobacterium bogoriense TaxID=246272 RepID=UPI0005524B02